MKKLMQGLNSKKTTGIGTIPLKTDKSSCRFF